MARHRPDRPVTAPHRPVTAAARARVAAKRAALVSRLMALHAIHEAQWAGRASCPTPVPPANPDQPAGP